MPKDTRVRSTSVVFPLLLIAFGTMLLLWRWLPYFDPWPVLGRYWPLLLILIGGGMIWDRTQRQRDPQDSPSFPVGSAVGTLLFLILLAILLWHGHAFARNEWSNIGQAHGHIAKTVDKGSAKAVHMMIEMPAGELRLEGGAEQLLQADFYFGGTWVAPSVDYSVESGVGALRIDQQAGGRMIGKSDNTWNLKVNDHIPLELKIDVGAGRGDLRLANIDLTRLELNIGAGQANVDLTGERSKDLQAEIQGGVGQAIVRLPKNVGVVATVHGGLGSIDVHGLKEEDGKYVNAAYGKSLSTLHLTVEGGIGQIKLDQE
jgi:N-terminal domain of toast_rack, DUF2154